MRFEDVMVWVIGIMILIQVFIIDAFSNQVVILMVIFCYLKLNIDLNKIQMEVKHNGRNKRINS
jgi:hypothetical protein